MHLEMPIKLSLCSIQPQLWVPHPLLQLGVRLPCHCSGVCTQITRNNFICMFYLIFHATLISKLNWQLSFMCVSYGYLLSTSPAGPPASWHLGARPPPSPKHFPSRLRLLPLAIPSCHTISVVWTPAAPGPGRAPAPVPSPPPAQRKSPLAHPKTAHEFLMMFLLQLLPCLNSFICHDCCFSLAHSLSFCLPSSLTHCHQKFYASIITSRSPAPSYSLVGLDRHWA